MIVNLLAFIYFMNLIHFVMHKAAFFFFFLIVCYKFQFICYFAFSKADTDIFSIFSPSASSASTPTGPAVGGFPSPPINSISNSNAPSTGDVAQNTDKYSGTCLYFLPPPLPP